MDTSEKQHLILKGDIKKAIFLLGVPIMLNNLIQTIYNLVDAYWVGKLGSTEIAAMSFTSPIVFMLMSLCMGISMGGTALIAQYIGADRHDKAEGVAGQLVLFGIILSLFATIGGYLATPWLLSAMGATGDLYTVSKEFVDISMLGSSTLFAFFIFSAIKQGEGDTRTPMVYGTISAVMNMILDPIFIFVFGWGIGGAALATAFSRGVVSIFAFYKLFNNNDGIRLKATLIKYNKELLSKVIKLGAPSSLGQSAESIGFMLLSAIVVTFGENTVAAMGIGNKVNGILIMPAMGFCTALITVVGQNLGNDNVERAKEAIKWSMILGATISAITAFIMFIYATPIVSLFAEDSDVISQSAFFLQLMCISTPVFAIFQMFIGTFQGSGHTFTAMCMMIGRLWVIRIPLILILIELLASSNAIWIGMSFTNIIAMFVALGVFMTGRWQTKVIKDESPADVTEEYAT